MAIGIVSGNQRENILGQSRMIIKPRGIYSIPRKKRSTDSQTASLTITHAWMYGINCPRTMSSIIDFFGDELKSKGFEVRDKKYMGKFSPNMSGSSTVLRRILRRRGTLSFGAV
jgi:hypothetical protein